jgi:hypothetical protein
LESLLINAAKKAGLCKLVNGTGHEYTALPESDLADMAFFIDQIRTVMPVLGFDFLREIAKPSAITQTTMQSTADVSPRFETSTLKGKIRALAQEIDGDFIVLKGSQARAEWAGASHSYDRLYKQLCDEGRLIPENGVLIFADDYAFKSPSAAAAIVYGRAANGRIEWLVEGSSQTYAAWQDQKVAAVGTAPSDAELTDDNS